MTLTFSIDQNNDLYLGSSRNLALASDLQAVLFVCQNAAQAIKGEMIFRPESGMPNFEAVWAGSPNIPAWEAAFRARVLTVDGVTGIKSFTGYRDGNSMRYTAEIITVYGTGAING